MVQLLFKLWLDTNTNGHWFNCSTFCTTLIASWRTRFLLALALHHRGVLVTLDKRLTAAAVTGGNAAIELIQPSR